MFECIRTDHITYWLKEDEFIKPNSGSGKWDSGRNAEFQTNTNIRVCGQDSNEEKYFSTKKLQSKRRKAAMSKAFQI